MKTIYMAQPNSQYGDSVYFPYTAGSLLAFAFEDACVKKNYRFASFIYKKEALDAVMQKIKNPDFIGFCCYVWNYEYNKALAKRIKEKYPNCITCFGGHQIYEKSDIIDSDFADIVMFGEGEENFQSLLIALSEGECLDKIPNIMYRRGDEKVFTEKAVKPIPERVSPYLGGWFDTLLGEEKELDFSAVLETNRGCPNHCAFCDWGNIKARVHQYEKEQVFREIDWFSEKKIEYVYCADGNFGLFGRDMEFVDYLIETHQKNGFPQKFQATYSKTNPETVFEINKKLNAAGMSKGATLSFQSMDETVLLNINRKNMPLSKFKQLMKLYHENGIPTYSEIILGLPGETYQSFKEGIEQLLVYGQHMAINFFNCEVLNNAEMNKPAYLKKYDIKSSKMEQYQYHTEAFKESVKEYSNIVTSTAAMPRKAWIDSNVLGVFVRAFHNLGLFQCYAIYLNKEKGVKYTDFYERFIAFCEAHPQTAGGKILIWLRSKFQSVIDGDGSLTYKDTDFGKLQWPLDEACFLMVLREIERFRGETEAFLASFFDDTALFEDIKRYQQTVVKTPMSVPVTLHFHYDWYRYFKAVYLNSYQALQKTENTLHFNPGYIHTNLPQFGIHTVWYGRRGGQNIISDIRYVD